MMTPAGFQHGRIENRIQTLLSSFVLSNGLGEVTPGDTGFWLERDPDTVRAPDVAFVSRDRVPNVVTGFFPGPPDLAVEIRSPNEEPKECASKIADYLRLGVRVVWDVDPQARSVTVHRTGAKPRVLFENDTLAEPTLLSDFKVTVKQFFPA